MIYSLGVLGITSQAVSSRNVYGITSTIGEELVTSHYLPAAYNSIA